MYSLIKNISLERYILSFTEHRAYLHYKFI